MYSIFPIVFANCTKNFAASSLLNVLSYQKLIGSLYIVNHFWYHRDTAFTKSLLMGLFSLTTKASIIFLHGVFFALLLYIIHILAPASKFIPL